MIKRLQYGDHEANLKVQKINYNDFISREEHSKGTSEANLQILR